MITKLKKINDMYINFDKKHKNGKLSFILLNGLGNTKISTDISKELIYESLKVLQ